MKPRTAEELAAWASTECNEGRMSVEDYYAIDQVRIKEVHAKARGLHSFGSGPQDWPNQTAPDGRLLINPNPAEKRYNNE